MLFAALSGFVLGRLYLAWHLVAGATAMLAITWRVVWGLLGPTYARFAGFSYGPATVVAHLRDLVGGRRHRYLGHNPLGAIMVFALLAIIAVIGLTGIVTLGGLLKQGPLRAVLSYANGVQGLRLHKLLAILLLTMIGAHVAGVIVESWRGHENLVLAMVTGDKPVGSGVTARKARGRPRATAVTMAVLITIAATAILGLSGLPGRGVPPAALDPVFAEQCGACHLAFPPSLAPASTWDSILADLQHHFGADATLAPDQVGQIRLWLDANAAAHWDTLPSHLLRTPASNGSLRITDTPGWRGMHHEIGDAVFAGPPVYRRSNCVACHGDAATGLFAPEDITIPSTAEPVARK